METRIVPISRPTTFQLSIWLVQLTFNKAQPIL